MLKKRLILFVEYMPIRKKLLLQFVLLYLQPQDKRFEIANETLFFYRHDIGTQKTRKSRCQCKGLYIPKKERCNHHRCTAREQAFTNSKESKMPFYYSTKGSILQMTREELKKLREEINSRPLSDFITLERPRKRSGANEYCCPICKSGTGKNGTSSFSIFPDTKRVICFSKGCFTDKGEDTLGALKTIWNCSEEEVFRKTNNVITTEPKKTETKDIIKIINDYSKFYAMWHQDLLHNEEALGYLHKRGITDESINKYKLGYCGTWKHSSTPNGVPTKRIIIPRNDNTYMARNIGKPRNDYELNRLKQIEGKQSDLFNLGALERANTVFICEGELDAISIMQAGAEACIAIGSVNNENRMFEEARKYANKVYILALDNDEKGKEAQEKLRVKMQEAGLCVIDCKTQVIYSKAKDANEAYVNSKDKFVEMIKRTQQEANARKTDLDKKLDALSGKEVGKSMFENFLNEIQDNSRLFEGVSTGIKELDKALEGGFIRRTLVTLGAAPGMGKTALAQWIFENVAQTGQDVLYINLEMDRTQLLARSLSRTVWKHKKRDFSTLDVLRGYAWTEEEKKDILEAAAIYQNEIATHFVYNPEGITNHIDSILSAMKEETLRVTSQGRPAPLICIDYLQLINSGEKDEVQGIKNVLSKLKDFAKNENTVVFIINANNRAANKSGTTDMESGRDTSAIEYTGDLMLGLSYTVIEDKKVFKAGEDKNGNPRYKEYDLEEIRRLKRRARDRGEKVPDVCNKISLNVVKGRFTEDERRVKLLFDGKHATFDVAQWRYERTETEEWEPIEDSTY